MIDDVLQVTRQFISVAVGRFRYLGFRHFGVLIRVEKVWDVVLCTGAELGDTRAW